jgi:hypothetical protein
VAVLVAEREQDVEGRERQRQQRLELGAFVA